MSTLPSPLNVLVAGYGLLGKHILNALTDPEFSSLTRSHQVKTFLLVRPASLADATKRAVIDQYVAKGATIVEGDLAQGPDAVATQLKKHNIHTVISALGRSPALEQQYPLIEAAKAAGVQHFIPSDFGTDYDSLPVESAIYASIAAPKIAVHDAVKKSGMDWTFIANGWFAELLYGIPVMGVDLKSRTVSAPISFNTPTTVTSLVDIGRLTAAAVTDPTTRNKQLYFGRPYTFEQIAQVVESATGETVVRRVRSKEELEGAVASSPADVGARFALSLLFTGNCFPVEQTYQNGQFEYTSLEAVVRQILNRSQPSQ